LLLVDKIVLLVEDQGTVKVIFKMLIFQLMGTCTDLKMVIGYRTYKSIIIGETEVFLSKRDSTYNLVDSIKLEMSL